MSEVTPQKSDSTVAAPTRVYFRVAYKVLVTTTIDDPDMTVAEIRKHANTALDLALNGTNEYDRQRMAEPEHVFEGFLDRLKVTNLYWSDTPVTAISYYLDKYQDDVTTAGLATRAMRTPSCPWPDHSARRLMT